MRRLCTALALGMAMCVIHPWDHTLASPVIGQEPPPRGRPSSRGSSESQENQAVNERLLKQSNDRIKGREDYSCRTGFQEHSNPVAEDSSGRAVSSHHERWIQPRPWRELHPLPCGGGFLERRQAPEARRPRMARMHRMINEQLGKMENLETAATQRSINCATCHRGAVSPLAADR